MRRLRTARAYVAQLRVRGFTDLAAEVEARFVLTGWAMGDGLIDQAVPISVHGW